jgi:ubiquinone/menaquinone biosynthesis C-methylase UbiE
MSKDLFSSHAGDYAKYRPTYPIELIEYISSFAERRESALDCATGNGQAALLLTEYFDQVFAIDLSENQIREALPHPKIRYSVSPAESTPFEENSFDAITIAQAYHWVNHERFAEEAKRIGRQNAVVAVIGYNLLRSANNHVTKLVDQFYNGVANPYWEPERKYVENNYKSAPFYFKELPVTRAFNMQIMWTIEEVEGYINTWSAIKKFIRVNGFNPVIELMQNIRTIWGNEETIQFDFPIALRLGRIMK